MNESRRTPEDLLRHAPHVRQLARRLVFDAELASEVEQETWLAAREYATRDLQDPKAWLSQVARRIANRLWSKRERRQDVKDRVVGVIEQINDSLPASAKLIRTHERLDGLLKHCSVAAQKWDTTGEELRRSADGQAAPRVS